jgi:hypothetical protein
MINIDESKAAADGEIGSARFYENEKSGQCSILFSKELRDIMLLYFKNGIELVGIRAAEIDGIVFVPKNKVSASISIKAPDGAGVQE